jgi:hypothetical protein
MAPTTTIEAFSLTHAQVLDGATSFDSVTTGTTAWGDVYGVNDASLDPDTDSYDNEGDDAVMSTWNWLNKADVQVQAGYFSFALVAGLTGRTISSTGSGDEIVYGLDLWHEDDFNVPRRPMIVRMPSKDSVGAVRYFDIGLYTVSFNPITFDGPSYKDGLKVNYGGQALMSSVDELGEPFADGKRRVGKTISRPVS